MFWRAIKSATEADFDECMEEMMALSLLVYDDFMKIGVEKFYRCKINTLNHCEVVDNNM